ncbi:calcium and integrin-binding protein 1-like isoform X2 [Tigriopus californicus]|uniref:calcium and integrin-binding protein 1-like isoform X2 n=1 Tax=Tigriopus californicus TaxID=6832 RepID=UPI0027DA4AC0|nr:calcium and integrin-binding protein 1-like isoform X2 [Tigriopus californicus]
MGGTTSKLDESLQKYEDLTYLNFKQIKNCHNRFTDIKKRENVNSGSLVDLTKPVCTYDDLFESVPELGHNPFRDRICDVFSSEQGRKLNFLEFLDICSVFNENASQEAKIKRAFQIFDFDNDGFIGKGDISKVIKTIVPDDSNTNLNITDAVSDQRLLVSLDIQRVRRARRKQTAYEISSTRNVGKIPRVRR